MSGLPNVLTICLNMPSVSFHSEDRLNILEFLSSTLSDPGMLAAEIHSCHLKPIAICQKQYRHTNWT